MAGEFDQRIGATEPGLSRVWLQRECLIVCCKCLIVALKLPQDISPSEPGFGKRGFKGKRLIIGLDRFVVTASANHRHRAFSISASARSKRLRFICGIRVLAQDRCIIFKIRNIRRLTRKGPRDERLGVFQIAGARLDDTEIVKPVNIARIVFQDILVKLGRPRQVSCLVIGKCGL